MAQLTGSHLPTNDWRDKTILITGYSGFIGGQLARRLGSLGANIIGLTREPESFQLMEGRAHLPPATLVCGDLDDIDGVREHILKYKPEMIFHLAAKALIDPGNPLDSYKGNVIGTSFLLETIRTEAPHIALLLASTAAIYAGNSTGITVDETSTPLPLNDYASSKLSAELLLADYVSNYGISAGTVRLTNVYGPGDTNFSRLIPGVMRAVVQGEHPTLKSDGSSLHDFVYVDDVTSGMMAFMRHLECGLGAGDIFNLSAGKSIRVIDIVEEILGTAERNDLEPKLGPYNSNKQKHHTVAATKAKQFLGWTPCIELSQGIANTFEWFQYLLPALVKD